MYVRVDRLLPEGKIGTVWELFCSVVVISGADFWLIWQDQQPLIFTLNVGNERQKKASEKRMQTSWAQEA